ETALPVAAGERTLDILIGPMEQPEQADGIIELFRDISGLGRVEVLPCDQATQRLFRVVTASSDTDLMDLFTFHISKEHIQLRLVDAAQAEPSTQGVEGRDFGFFDNAPGLPPTDAAVAPTLATGAPAEPASKAAPKVDSKAVIAAPAMESSTLRVSVSKVDQLINLVGELVIT